MQKDVFKAFDEEMNLCKKIGFLWLSHQEILAQIRSELTEIENAIENKESEARIQEELGDLIDACFSLIDYLGFKPKETSFKAIQKVTLRIEKLKSVIQKNGHAESEKIPIKQLLKYWDEIKKFE